MKIFGTTCNFGVTNALMFKLPSKYLREEEKTKQINKSISFDTKSSFFFDEE